MARETSTGDNRQVLSVSDLNFHAKRLLEGEFPTVYVEGEISNFSAPGSGHWYFTLKDQKAQIRCAMFRNRNMRIRFKPTNGAQIIVRGKISLFEARGDFQMIAEHMEEAGDGALRRAFDQLKVQLTKEGLFDESRKRPLPAMPQHIGIITSANGAAIHDVLTVMKRRFPAIRISILPVQVQGEDSPAQIVRAFDLVNQMAEPFDAVLLTRGGGSLEDLWSFNVETVARAVAACRVPVVCAVGHESDVSIADFVADLRAATPSAAAELLTPDVNQWLDRVAYIERRLSAQMASQLQNQSQSLDYLRRRLRSPSERLANIGKRLTDLSPRLGIAVRQQIKNQDIAGLAQQLHRATGQHLVALRQAVGTVSQFEKPLRQQLQIKQLQLQSHAQKLDALSPLRTLDRGYAIVTDDEGHVIIDAAQANVGSTINARLANGNVTATVTSNDKES